MRTARPSFSSMLAAYPTGTVPEVKTLIGGRVNAGWISNTCVIRVSRALNYAGEAHKVKRTPIMNTISGSDGLWYGYRVREFIPYFTEKYGSPDFDLKSGAYEQKIALGTAYGPAVLSQGVIAVEIPGWNNATGHVDLWNGNHCASWTCLTGDYLKKATKVLFWKLP